MKLTIFATIVVAITASGSSAESTRGHHQRNLRGVVAPVGSSVRDAATFWWPHVVTFATRYAPSAGLIDGCDVLSDPSLARTDNAIPWNTFLHMSLPDITAKLPIRKPNFDTLYSIAYLDLTDGHADITLPQTQTYWMMQLMDTHQESFPKLPGVTPNSISIGGHSKVRVRLGSQSIAGDASTLDTVSPTPFVWIIFRLECSRDETQLRTAEQRSMVVRMASIPATSNASGGFDEYATAVAGIDRSLAPIEMVEQMSFEQYLGAVQYIYDNWFLPGDKSFAAAHPPSLFNRKPRLSADVIQHFDPNIATAKYMAAGLRAGTVVNTAGWIAVLGDEVGAYGVNSDARVALGLVGLGANRVSDAIYPSATHDSAGRALLGGESYLMTFSETINPSGFISLTGYDMVGNIAPSDESGAHLMVSGIRAGTKVIINPTGKEEFEYDYAIRVLREDSDSNTDNFELTMRIYSPVGFSPASLPSIIKQA